MVTITEVTVGSRAERAGISAGDVLVSVGGREIRDVLDYRFYLAEEKIRLSLLKDGKTPYEVLIEKETYDDIGLGFATALMDEKQSCRNKCVFCFIDQLPPGLRESLYFKDDDSRLSFLHGNYITLTNMTDRDIDRIVEMRFSPINISVHTANPELRVKMMRNKDAGRVLSYLPRLAAAGITLSCQIVLCRGLNDGEELDRSMQWLASLSPAVESVSIVPAGMTAYRDKLYPLTAYSRDEARAVIAQVDAFAERCLAERGSRIFFCADELYLRAGLPLPEESYYEGYPQLDNGVGMLRSLREEFFLALADAPRGALRKKREVTLVTGVAASSLMQELAAAASEKIKRLTVTVRTVKNDFFGHSITVAGLLTGRDIRAQLAGLPLGDEVLIPATTLRAGEDVFLCDMTRAELEESLAVPVTAVESDGYALLSALLGCKGCHNHFS